ncbi:heavy-metal-associated domain-containing protein [Croceibacter atlanticus]|uniref:heavy-metal-associated domain-containing protein n=1 Tax=Croceibacter atlanticus TaxID=313588 RepID=UPI0024936D7B|nr:heavy metal-associated domain-containing protein [Croceibacter atlanticus]
MRTSIIVQNLKCGGCANTITTKLSQLENVTNIVVDTESSTVSFVAISSDDALNVKERLRTLGYPSIEDVNGMISKAKSFVSCATGKIK